MQSPRHYAALVAAVGIGIASIATAASATTPNNWSGFYIGGSVGGIVEHASGTSDFLDPSAAAGLQTNPQGNSFYNSHAIGGVQAGYNWQFNQRWVLGLEADWNWTHSGYALCRQTDALSVACTDNGFGFESISSTTDWVATVRGRLGVTVSDFLLYATGGAAFGRIETALQQSCLVGGCGNSFLVGATSSTSSTDKAGWVAGLGAEYALNANWSAKAEWLYIDLGMVDSSLTVIGMVGGPPTPAPQITTWSRREQYNIFRVGLNYRFH